MPAAPASRAAGREVTPVELFRLLPAHFAAVLVCTLLGGILAFAAARLAPRSYQAEAQLYVAAAQEGLTSGYAELQLTADYQELLTSRTMLESVISTLGLSTDTAHLKDQITQLANAGRLDQDAVRMISLHDLFQCLAEVAHQGAADAAGVQLVDLNASLTHKAAVNADLAEFVFDQHNLFTLERFLDELFDQSRFACTQKAGENINFSYLFCHGNIPFYLKVCLCC